jgi:hypothetical protein
MFELYQVKSVSVKFVPYHFEYAAGALSGLTATGFPVMSIVDPDDLPPTVSVNSSFFSYGNCKITKPYDIHTRAMHNYTDLGLSK